MQKLRKFYNDVFGPFLVSSLGKSTYFVSFIHDFQMNIWIYFLRKIWCLLKILKTQGPCGKLKKEENQGVKNRQWWRILWEWVQ